MLTMADLLLLAVFAAACWILLPGASALDTYPDLVDTSDPSKFLACATASTSAAYCVAKNYSKLEVPFDERGLVDVSVDLDVLQILEVNDIDFTVSFSMYFGVRWEEPRF